MLQVYLRDHPGPCSPLFKLSFTLVFRIARRHKRCLVGIRIFPNSTSDVHMQKQVGHHAGLAFQRSDDLCRHWELWTHPEDIEANIVCFAWRDRHRLSPMDIAAALAFLGPKVYWVIKTDDVIKVCYYLNTHQDIPENRFASWQMMREMRMHPSWRYHVVWASPCNIRRIQDLLDQLLLAVYKQG